MCLEIEVGEMFFDSDVNWWGALWGIEFDSIASLVCSYVVQKMYKGFVVVFTW